MDGDIIATCMLLLYIYPVVISSGLPLRTVLGVSNTYKPGSDVAELSWQLHPPNAKIFYVKCNHSNNGTSTHKVLTYEWNNSDPTFLHNLNKKATINRNDTTFSIIIHNPTKQDTGWYICVFNTQQSVDIQESLKLDKLSDSVQYVQGLHRNFTVYDSAVSLVWTIHPPFANVSHIHCFTQHRGTQVAILQSKKEINGNWESNDSTTFKGKLHESYFELLVTRPSDATEGDYNCSFVSENSVKSSVAKLSLVSASVKSLSLATLPWKIATSLACTVLLAIIIAISVLCVKRRLKASVAKEAPLGTSVGMSPLPSSSQQSADAMPEAQPLTSDAKERLDEQIRATEERCNKQLRAAEERCNEQLRAAEERCNEQLRAAEERCNEQLRAAEESYNQDKIQLKDDLRKKQEEVTAVKKELEESKQKQKHSEGEDQVDHGIMLQKQAEEKEIIIAKLKGDIEKMKNDYDELQRQMKTQITTKENDCVAVQQKLELHIATTQQRQTQLQEQLTSVDEKLLKTKQKLREKKEEVQDLRTELKDLPDNLTWEVRQKANQRFSDMQETEREALFGKIIDILLESLHDIKNYAKKKKQEDENYHMKYPENHPARSTAELGVRFHGTATLHDQALDAQEIADYAEGAAAANLTQSSTALHTDATTSDASRQPSSGKTQSRPPEQQRPITSQTRPDMNKRHKVFDGDPDAMTVNVAHHKTASNPQMPTETPSAPPNPPGSQPHNEDE